MIGTKILKRHNNVNQYPHFATFQNAKNPLRKGPALQKGPDFAGKLRKGNSAPMVVNMPKVVHSSIVMTSQGRYFYLKRLKMKIMAYRDISSI